MLRSSRLFMAVLLMPLASAALADPQAEVESTFRKVMADKSYNAVITSEAKRRTTVIHMLVQLPDRFHMKTEGMEVIILPEGTWMNASGQWMRSPVNMSQMIAGYTGEAMEKGIGSIGKVEYVGEEDVQGCTSKNYRYSQSGEFMGMKSQGESLLSICQSNGKPVRIVSKEAGKSDSVTITYDWDTPVNIRAPR